jgi:hypothetical protein
MTATLKKHAAAQASKGARVSDPVRISPRYDSPEQERMARRVIEKWRKPLANLAK